MGDRSRFDAVRIAGALGLAALAAFAFRDLLVFSPTESLLEETSDFLFVRTNTSPPIALALAAWLLYRRRGALRRATDGPPAPWLGAGLLAAGAAAYAWATYVQVAELLVLALIPTGLGAAVLAWGRGALRALWVPAGVLLFAIPVPAPLYNVIVFPLQLVTAEYSAWLLEPLGIPAFLSMDRILLTDKSFQVIEGCSGFRSIQTLTLVAILYVDLFYRSRLQAVILVGIAPILAFFLNGIRILTMMLNPYSEIVSVHAIQGVVVLLGGLLLLHGLDALLARLAPRRYGALEVPASGGFPAVPRTGAVALAGMLCAFALAQVALPRWDPSGLAEVPIESALAGPRVGDFVPTRTRLDAEGPFLGKVGVAQSLHRRYVHGRDFVDVFIGYWDRGRPDVSPFSRKTRFPGSGWILEQEGETRLGEGELRVDTLQVRRWTTRQLVYHWTEGQRSLAAESLRSFLALDRALGPRSRGAFVVRLSTNLEDPSEAGRAAAEARLRDFAEAIREGLHPLTRASPGGGKTFPKLGTRLRLRAPGRV